MMPVTINSLSPSTSTRNALPNGLSSRKYFFAMPGVITASSFPLKILSGFPASNLNENILKKSESI